jgi:hypothetical protein
MPLRAGAGVGALEGAELAAQLRRERRVREVLLDCAGLPGVHRLGVLERAHGLRQARSETGEMARSNRGAASIHDAICEETTGPVKSEVRRSFDAIARSAIRFVAARGET